MAQESSPRKWIFASLFAAILGLIDTALLTAQHYRIANEGLMQKSFCTLSSFIDCDTALTSEYAHVLNIPNSELGFLYYAVAAILLIWALASSQRQRSILEFLLLASGAAALYSLYMAYLLTAKLRIICLFCMGSHILAVAIFILLLIATKTPIWKLIHFIGDYFSRTFKAPDEETKRTSFVQYLVSSIVIFGVGILFFFGLNERAHSGPPQFSEQSLLRHFYSQEPIEIPTEGKPILGNKEAPITIAEFSDFQCPFCRRAAFSLKPYLGKFRNDVRIVFNNYPLDQSCNPAMQQAMHPAACIAAKAALCVYQEKGDLAFWKFHDLIFENQKRISHSLLTKTLAPEIGMTAAALGECIASNQIEGRLAQDVELGNSIKISGTPAIYINGRYLSGWVEPKILRTIVKYELKRLKGEWTPSP